MGLSIRLKRQGSNHKPFYRVVAVYGRRTPNGMACDSLGYWDPLAKGKKVNLDAARIKEWVARGATLSPSVARLVRAAAGDKATA